MTIISVISADKSVVSNKTLVRAMLVTGFVIMTALGAYLRIPLPFSPVPITLQTFFVILCGAVLGKRLGAFAQVSYVALGALGMPIFQGYGAGLLHLAGPTGGYLIGFIIAAFIVGTLTDRKHTSPSFSYIIFSMAIGLLAIYLCGIAWLMISYRIDLIKAAFLGFIPFIPGAVAKLIVASWIYSKIKARTSFLIQR